MEDVVHMRMKGQTMLLCMACSVDVILSTSRRSNTNISIDKKQLVRLKTLYLHKDDQCQELGLNPSKLSCYDTMM